MKLKLFISIIALVCCSFTCLGYAALTDELEIRGTVTAIPPAEELYIVSVTERVSSGGASYSTLAHWTPDGQDGSSIKRCCMSSTITLGAGVLDSKLTFTVKFHNNTDHYYVYDGISHGTTDAEYSNSDITYHSEIHPIYIAPGADLELTLTFSYPRDVTPSSNELYSVLSFNFHEFVDPDGNSDAAKYFDTTNQEYIGAVIGNSSDNLSTLSDGASTYHSSTKYRWTNWSSGSSGWGATTSIIAMFPEETNVNNIVMHHFVDCGAGNSSNGWSGSCDLPQSVTISYFDADVGKYIEIATVTATSNYTSAARNTYGVYVVTFTDNTTATLDHKYTGTVPATTYSFDDVYTSAIKITIVAKPNYFVGITELEVNHDNENVLR